MSELSLMDILGYIGDSADKPGRAFRGALSGNAREALSFIPFSDKMGWTDPEQAVSGRDLIQKAGWVGEDDNSFGWDDAAGMGLEMLLDPTNLIPGAMGLKAAGKVKKAKKVASDWNDYNAAAIVANGDIGRAKNLITGEVNKAGSLVPRRQPREIYTPSDPMRPVHVFNPDELIGPSNTLKWYRDQYLDINPDLTDQDMIDMWHGSATEARNGLLKKAGGLPADLPPDVQKLMSKSGFHQHGAVTDPNTARKAEPLPETSTGWAPNSEQPGVHHFVRSGPGDSLGGMAGSAAHESVHGIARRYPELLNEIDDAIGPKARGVASKVYKDIIDSQGRKLGAKQLREEGLTMTIQKMVRDAFTESGPTIGHYAPGNYNPVMDVVDNGPTDRNIADMAAGLERGLIESMELIGTKNRNVTLNDPEAAARAFAKLLSGDAVRSRSVVPSGPWESVFASHRQVSEDVPEYVRNSLGYTDDTRQAARDTFETANTPYYETGPFAESPSMGRALAPHAASATLPHLLRSLNHYQQSQRIR